jgi:hypothetical protein
MRFREGYVTRSANYGRGIGQLAAGLQDLPDRRQKEFRHVHVFTLVVGHRNEQTFLPQ